MSGITCSIACKRARFQSMQQRYVYVSSPIEERLHLPRRTRRRHVTRLEPIFLTRRKGTFPGTIFQGQGSRRGQIPPQDRSHARQKSQAPSSSCSKAYIDQVLKRFNLQERNRSPLLSHLASVSCKAASCVGIWKRVRALSAYFGMHSPDIVSTVV